MSQRSLCCWFTRRVCKQLKMSCSPTYAFRPNFVPGEQKCDTPLYQEFRARSGLIRDTKTTPTDPDDVQGWFVRSRKIGYENNDVSVQSTTSLFIVRFQGVIVETYNYTSFPTT